jgi:hypothetical protein
LRSVSQGDIPQWIAALKLLQWGDSMDIKERLRQTRDWPGPSDQSPESKRNLACDALEEIERLEGVIALKRPMQPVVLEDGVIRFKENRVVCYLLDRVSVVRVDLNTLNVIKYLFPQDDWDQFHQLIGYSVSGYSELSSVSPESIAAAEKLRQHVKKD